ncbi:hypothetical protein GPAL_2163 [Glaciecola pallidula DSM 14239 = ACAM 615]|uniref:Uncharacterized protein n=1 Tax=Brumicola pallidula DSM 14239 = ACAM 615 TaxID=1121922 RepID=K6Y8D8_9ALTE|nr:hypothetical protein GPAL_2163 [Glaciecola pallidula DSM 14239 = ACAM 615]
MFSKSGFAPNCMVIFAVVIKETSEYKKLLTWQKALRTIVENRAHYT